MGTEINSPDDIQLIYFKPPSQSENNLENFQCFDSWCNIVLWEIIDENHWRKIGNRMGYDIVEDIILEPQGLPDAKNLIFIHPIIKVEDAPKEIMVVLWGYRYESGQYCEDRHAGRLLLKIYPQD